MTAQRNADQGAKTMVADALFMAVREILMRDRDPIGINDVQDAYDEYDEYAAIVTQMIRKGASREEFYRYLRGIETGSIGLHEDRERASRAAERLSALT